MRVIIFLSILCVINAQSQFWSNPQKFFSSLFRQAKTGENEKIKIASSDDVIPTETTTKATLRYLAENTVTFNTEPVRNTESTDSFSGFTTEITSSKDSKGIWSTEEPDLKTTTLDDSTTLDFTSTESNFMYQERKNSHQKPESFLSKREKPIQTSSNISQNLLPLPAGAGAALVKPTKYHYYPHNQHIYLLPECAIQQVCNAVYIRLNWTQPLCACPSRYRDPCSASLNSDDNHTTELMIDGRSRVSKALTLVKTCEPITEMRICHSPRDWSLLALQNIRTGKSHYLVICRCPDSSILEGPMSHDQPTYASVPGIRVYGMMCVDPKRKRSSRKSANMTSLWTKALEFSKTVTWG